MSEKPKIYTILKVLGGIGLFLGILLIILGTAVFPITNNGCVVAPSPALFAPGMILLGVSVFVVFAGFIPNIQKGLIKTTRYVQQENKVDLKAIADDAVDITGEAIKQTSKNIKEGLEGKIYCKHCGENIDEDSIFCSKCGKQL